MKKNVTFLFFLLVVLTCVGFAACSDDKNSPEPEYNASAEKLKGTTWHYYKRIEHLAHRDREEQVDYYWTFLPTVATKLGYKMEVEGFDCSGVSWFFSINTNSHRECLWIDGQDYPPGFGEAICCSCHDIISWTDNEIILGHEGLHEIYLKRVP